MSGYTVSFPDVGASAAGLVAEAAELRAHLRGLAVSVESLLHSGWRGAAAAAFESDWQLWRAAAADVIDVLGDLAVVLGAGGQAYAATEAAVRQTLA